MVFCKQIGCKTVANIIQFIIKRTRAQRTRARQLRRSFNATRIMISSTQYVFNSCSFNYKLDYNKKHIFL